MKKSVFVLFFTAASLFAPGKLAAEDAAAAVAAASDEELILDDEVSPAQKNSENTDSVKTASGIIENDEELILDGGEEDLLGPSKTQNAAIVNVPSDQNTVVNDELNTDSTTSVSSESEKTGNTLPTPEQLVRSPVVQNARIEDMESINFAQNLKGYRKPLTAMLLSFLVPGAGQLYCHNSLKTSIFGVVEAAIIGTGSAVYAKGKKDYKKSYTFADQHYYGSKVNDYYQKLVERYDDSIAKAIFLDVSIDTFVSMVESRDKNYYSFIDDPNQPYIRGWDDVTPNFTEGTDFTPIEPGYKNYKGAGDGLDSTYLIYRTGDDSSKFVFGYSKNMEEFQRMQNKADKKLKVAKGVFTTLLVNHIMSMIDAGLTAKAYNNQLLGKETFWQRINIKEKNVKSGSKLIPGYALEIRF